MLEAIEPFAEAEELLPWEEREVRPPTSSLYLLSSASACLTRYLDGLVGSQHRLLYIVLSHYTHLLLA